MTSSKSIGFIFLSLALLPFAASSQTIPKIADVNFADDGSTAEHPTYNHHRGAEM